MSALLTPTQMYDMLAPQATSLAGPGPVVVADDNEDDLFFFRRALTHVGATCPVVALRDGHQTIEYLKQVCGERRPEGIPEILFLDLNMPRASGFSVLCWLREQEMLRHLKVVILSDSNDPGDIALATALEADAYLPKFPSEDVLVDLLRRFAPATLSHPAAVHTAA